MAEKFHTELKNLKTETLEMAHLGRFMLRTAVDALIRQDKELAASVVARKEEIHQMEVRLEERCYRFYRPESANGKGHAGHCLHTQSDYRITPYRAVWQR